MPNPEKRWKPPKRRHRPAEPAEPPALVPLPQPDQKPVYDPNDEAHRVLWYIHERRVKRYGRAAGLFRDDTSSI